METTKSLSASVSAILLALSAPHALGQTMIESKNEAVTTCYKHGQDREFLKQRHAALMKAPATPKNLKAISDTYALIAMADVTCLGQSSSIVGEAVSRCYKLGQDREFLRAINEGLLHRPGRTEEYGRNSALIATADIQCIRN